MKLTKRKGFNFFRSYYDVYNLLSNEDKVAFMDALLDRQFLGVKPDDLEGMAQFAYVSQTNSIDSQVKGYEDKTKTKLNPLDEDNYPPTVGVNKKVLTPSLQVEVQEKEKVEVQEKEEINKAFSFRKSMYGLGLEKSLVDDFLKNRKLKRLANTETAYKNLVIEFNKNDVPIVDLMTKIVSSGWGSFKNSWLTEEKNKKVEPQRSSAVQKKVARYDG